MISEESFNSWAQGPGSTEEQKIANAETAIRKAIEGDPVLSKMDYTLISQGSYRSKTNVRQASDVDFCLCLNSTFFPYYPSPRTKEDYGNLDGSISFAEFRGIVYRALVNHFGSENITVGSKAFDIHSNTYRVDADVVPAFAYRHYERDRNVYIKPTGIAFIPTTGPKIINWPIQAYGNGLGKHEATGRRYRKMVRILKRMRDRMRDDGIAAANDIGSFQLESLVWNVPNDRFGHSTYTDDVKAVIQACYAMTKADADHASLTEVNGLKLLFGAHQQLTPARANDFFAAALNYAGF